MIGSIKRNSQIIASCMIILASVYALIFLLLPLDVFLWDESHHGYYAMNIYNSIRAFDLPDFWASTNHQALWMPLHSWWSAIFLLVFGFSYTAARLSSLFLFIISAFLVYSIALKLSKDKGDFIGIISVFFFVTSPQMLSLATLHMQEFMGIAICLYLVHYMISSGPNESSRKELMIGFILSVAYWTKTNYAAILIVGVGLYQLSKLFELNKTLAGKAIAQWFKANMTIMAGFLPLFILWWATPPFQRKYALGLTFRQGSVAAPGGSMISSTIGSAGYYLQSIMTSYNFSLWLGLGCIAALIASLYFYRNRAIRLISLMFLANFLFVSIMSFVQERYISTAEPFLFILLAYFIVLAAEKVMQAGKNIRVIFAAITIILLSMVAWDIAGLTLYTRLTANRCIMSIIYKENMSRFSPDFMFGLLKRPQATIPLLDKKFSDFQHKPISRLEDALKFFSSNIERDKSISTMSSLAQFSPYVFYWHFHNWGSPVFTKNDLAAGAHNFWFSDYFIDIETSANSPYYIDVLDYRWKDIEPKLLRSGMIRLVSKKEFPDIGMTAKIFKREGFARF